MGSPRLSWRSRCTDAASRAGTGVHLFGRRPVNAERRLKNTRAVEDQLKKDGIAPPRGLTHDLTPALKNPDVVAYDRRRKEWRFCEVKRTERVQPGQIAGLAVLHLLTGGAVTVVRLVHDKDFVSKEHEARVMCSTRSQVLTAASRRRNAEIKRTSGV